MKQWYIKAAVTTALIIYAGVAFAQSLDSRLIAQTRYIINANQLVAFDSQTYIYPNNATALYTRKMGYQNNLTAFIHTRKQDFTYNSAGKLTYMEFKNWVASSSSYINGGMTFYTLNSAGFTVKDSNMLWIPANNAYRKNVRNTYQVNSAGLILDQVYEYWDFGLNDLLPTYHYENTYNAQGNPLVRLMQDWDASIQWMDKTKTIYAYDASGMNLQTVTGEQSVTLFSPLQLIYQNVYTLNANGTVAVCLSNMWNASTSSYKPSMKIIMSYDANGDNTEEVWEQWDIPTNAYKPWQKFVRTYNSYHQKTSDNELEWNGTAYATPAGRENFYYEEYSAPTAVSNTPAFDATLSVVPIPTNGDVHIALNWETPQAFTTLVTDMNGRMCHTFSAPASKQYTGQVNLSHLPAGNYVLSIKGEHGGSASRVIVLQH